MKITIVIANWNGQELLKKNLPFVIKACRNWARTGWEIIVADDASTDESVAFLKKNFPQVKVVVASQNQRFAANCNLGVKAARGEVVVILNNDVSPEVKFLKPLISHFQNPRVFAVGCKERDKQSEKIIYSGRGLGEFKRGFLVHWRAQDQNQKETLWASGGSMAVDRKKWLVLGGMDPLFRPAYWEDIDLAWRARKRGWQILFEPRAVVNHHHETTNLVVFGRKQMKKFAYKNQFLFVWKNGDLKMIVAHFFWLPYHFLKAIIKKDGLFYQGFFLALKQLPELVKEKISK
jgi:GT2 family glycosyltransferase